MARDMRRVRRIGRRSAGRDEGREAGVVERGEQRFLAREEHGVYVAEAVQPAWPAAQDAGLTAAVAFDGLDDVEQADLGRRPREAIAARATRRGLDEAGPRQVAEDLGQEPDRDV